MTTKRQREIVIEFEQVKMIRKRAKTQMLNCRSCLRETDFVPLPVAAELFATETEQIFTFIQARGCHFETAAQGEILLCLVSLLTQMKSNTSISGIKLIGQETK